MPENNSRLLISNSQEFTSVKLTDHIVGEKLTLGQIFMIGQVIDSIDPKKGNRLRVRIPILDDVFYRDDKGNLTEEGGHDKLPWCIPANDRFINTPENGTIVLIGLFDPENPYLGRVWFTEMDITSSLDIFDVGRLKEVNGDDTAWKDSENLTGVKYNFSPTNKNRTRFKSKSKTINYKVGIKGKGKNKLLFDQTKTTLIQNEGEDNETKIELNEKLLAMSKTLEILSSNTPNRKENPVFAEAYFDYQTKILGIIQKIANLLNTTPALSSGVGTVMIPSTPLLPNPAFAQIVAEIVQTKTKLEQLKQPGEGSSQYITIN